MAYLPLPRCVPGERRWLPVFAALYIAFVLATLGASALFLAAAVRVH